MYYTQELQLAEAELRSAIPIRRRRELHNRLPYLRQKAAAEKEAAEQFKRLKELNDSK